MKKFCGFTLIILFLICALSLSAQTNLGSDKLKIGLGASLGKEILPVNPEITIKMTDFPNIYFSLLFTHFRIEPHYGFYYYSYSDAVDRVFNVHDIGLGIFWKKDYCGGDANLTAGIRGGLLWTYYKYDDGVSTDTGTRKNIYIGPALGGEYFFCDHISFSGEVQVIYTMFGDWDIDDGGAAAAEDVTEFDFKTRTMFFVRWYF